LQPKGLVQIETEIPVVNFKLLLAQYHTSENYEHQLGLTE